MPVTVRDVMAKTIAVKPMTDPCNRDLARICKKIRWNLQHLIEKADWDVRQSRIDADFAARLCAATQAMERATA